MKMYFQLLFAFILTGMSCNKSKSNSDSQGRDGVITGYDQRMCPCCGGLMINFNNNATPYADHFFLIRNDLSSFGIPASSTFPVFVRVKYTVEQNCGDTTITITQLIKK